MFLLHCCGRVLTLGVSWDEHFLMKFEEQFQRRVHPRSIERAMARTGGKNSAKAGTRAG